VRCDDCRRAFDRARNARRPWYGGDWAKLARTLKRTVRVCQRCGRPGAEVDHVTPRRRDGGLELLCTECHRLKTSGTTTPTSDKTAP
jgi:5-methylcytosine-specific restriction endonuclease McrA